MADDEREVRLLYGHVLSRWNRRDAREFAALFCDDGSVVGFDGSSHDGRAAIESELSQIFAHHPTPAFVGKIRRVRFLTADVAVVSAGAGMVPAGQSDPDPELSAKLTEELRQVLRGGATPSAGDRP